ncbi:MAG: hypothetical protein OEY22_02415 [Candidatus Bathyarchaeota archaeon]|nr:hypothetical protein [Candidatus Bathyarchaeota archaeon]
MYDRDATETSKGALVELCRVLRQYRHDMVLAGGWAPYFLVKDFFDHCGSVDIDFVLRPKVVERYENIKQILERIGYKPTESVFRFERTVASSKTGIKHRIEVDFLTEPEGAEKLPEDWFASVQRDLKACVIEGCSIVFKYNHEVGFSAVMPGNGEASVRFNCADIVGSLTMKGLALYRMKDKDCYDIYAVGGFCGGGPKQASDAFMHVIGEKESEKVTLDALSEIRDAFASETSYGPSAVARFVGSEDAKIDSYMRIKTFLQGLSV